MITYCWNKNRILLDQSSSSLRRGDLGVGSIEFIIPSTIEGVTVDAIPLSIRYTLPNGDTYLQKITEVVLGYKDGYNKYSFTIPEEMTSISGDVEFDLRSEKSDSDTGTFEVRIYSDIAHLTIAPNDYFFTVKS